MTGILAEVDRFRPDPDGGEWVSYLCFKAEVPEDYPRIGDEIAVLDWVGKLNMAFVIDIDDDKEAGAFYIRYSNAIVSELA